MSDSNKHKRKQNLTYLLRSGNDGRVVECVRNHIQCNSLPWCEIQVLVQRCEVPETRWSCVFVWNTGPYRIIYV